MATAPSGRRACKFYLCNISSLSTAPPFKSTLLCVSVRMLSFYFIFPFSVVLRKYCQVMSGRKSASSSQCFDSLDRRVGIVAATLKGAFFRSHFFLREMYFVARIQRYIFKSNSTSCERSQSAVDGVFFEQRLSDRSTSLFGRSTETRY